MAYLKDWIKAYRMLRTGRNESGGMRHRPSSGRCHSFYKAFRLSKELKRQRLLVKLLTSRVDDRSQFRIEFLRRMGINVD